MGANQEESEQAPEVTAYRAAVMAVIRMAREIQAHDIEKLIRAIEQADAVGPLFHPTAWIEKNKAMNEDKETLRAALPLLALGRKLSKMRDDKLQAMVDAANAAADGG